MWLLLAGKAPAQNRRHEGWPGQGWRGHSTLLLANRKADRTLAWSLRATNREQRTGLAGHQPELNTESQDSSQGCGCD